ncbi:MAG: ATP-binding protein [Ignavibacteriales bacterium]
MYTNNISANYLLYSVISVCVIQLSLILVFLLRKNRRKHQTITGTDASGRSVSAGKADSSDQGKGRIGKGNQIDLSNEDELADLLYSYGKLKKEYSNLQDINHFLNQQINDLKRNIDNLEVANHQLSLQKEKLLNSKRQLEELQRQKDELYAMALHDIKNPAAAIKGYVELLESYDLNANEQQEIMQSLADTSSRIISLTQQMSLAIAKREPGPELKFEVSSVKKIADAVCNRNTAYALKKGIKLLNQTSPNTPGTKIDVSKIEEVMDNLVNNAIKYAPKGTTIQVRSYFNDSKITIEVTDNGVGLSEEECTHVFEKGVLLSPKPTGGETRSGLGLWIVKNIVEEHGGSVWVKSKTGAGSTFAFELPVRKM